LNQNRIELQGRTATQENQIEHEDEDEHEKISAACDDLGKY